MGIETIIIIAGVLFIIAATAIKFRDRRDNQVASEIADKIIVDEVYKAEPKVQKVEKVETPKVDTSKPIVVAKKVAVKAKPEKVEKKAPKEPKAVKVSRSWYNNGKTQKLVPANEVEALPKTWNKGKLPKGAK